MDAAIILGAVLLCIMFIQPITIHFILKSHEKERRVLLDTIRQQALGGHVPVTEDTPKGSGSNNFLLDYMEQASRRGIEEDE